MHFDVLPIFLSDLDLVYIERGNFANLRNYIWERDGSASADIVMEGNSSMGSP